MRKIGRVAKGEVVVVRMMEEDLQCLYDKLSELSDELARAREVFEADDFGKEFTPELRAQEERLRAQIKPKP